MCGHVCRKQVLTEVGWFSLKYWGAIFLLVIVDFIFLKVKKVWYTTFYNCDGES